MNARNAKSVRMRATWVVIIVAIVSALALVGCGSSKSSGAKSGGSSSKPKVIGVSFYNNVIPLYTLMQMGMKSEAAKKHVTLKYSYANNSAATQAEQVTSFVNQHVDAILVTPIEAGALTRAYKDAADANIPIISFGNKVADKDEDAFVGRDWSEVGRQMMEATAAGIGNSGDIIELAGPPDIEYVQGLQKGFDGVLAKHPGMKVVGKVNITDQAQGAALGPATNLLTAHPGVKAVVGTSDDYSLAAVQAIGELKLDKKKIFVTGLNALPEAVTSIKSTDGMDYTISLKPISWGALSVDTALDFANGKKPSEHTVKSPLQEVTKSNVNSLTQAQLG